MPFKTGVKAFDDEEQSSELNYQNATAGTPNQAALKTADIARHRAGRDGAIASGVSPIQHMTALRELGVYS